MGGDFPNLTSDIMANWPSLSDAPVTRGWYSPYALALAVSSTVILSARLHSQITKSYHGFAIDDLLVCLGWIFAILFTASSVAGVVNYGFNRHIWDVQDEYHNRAALTEWLSEAAFVISMCFTKISVLFFYRRLEPPCTRPLKLIIFSFMAFTAAYSIACILTQVLLCRPTSAYWTIPDRTTSLERSCASEHAYYPIQGVFDALSTFYCIMIPVLVLRNRPMSKFQRNGLRATSLSGLLVLGASIARTVLLSRLADSDNGDATWNGYNVFIWAQLECQLALLCASIPFLQRYFKHYPSVPIVFVDVHNDIRSDSVMSRVSSSLSGQIKRLPFARSASPRNLEISRPRPQQQPVEIPEWEFERFASPRPPHSPLDEHTYDRYLAGMYGPPVPPKDNRAMFDDYRREHGDIV